MASATDICNIGLGYVGADATVANISPPDGSVEAGHCARLYPIARKELLEVAAWRFAKTRVALAEVTNDSTIWAYAYALPSDMIRPLRILPLALLSASSLAWSSTLENPDWALVDAIFTEKGSSNFDIEGSVLRTDEPDAVLLYTRDVTDTTKFSPIFVSSFGMLMAAYLAGPLIKGLEGAKVAVQWRDAALRMAAKAAASDANGSSEDAEHLASALRARA